MPVESLQTGQFRHGPLELAGPGLAAVVIATGSAAAIPPLPGLAEAAPWTNVEATTAKHVPPRLAILGGGVVGVEMAQAWSSLGSQVTLVHRGERLIEREERFASEEVLTALREDGVDVRLGTSAASVSRNGDVRVELSASGGLLDLTVRESWVTRTHPANIGRTVLATIEQAQSVALSTFARTKAEADRSTATLARLGDPTRIGRRLGLDL